MLHGKGIHRIVDVVLREVGVSEKPHSERLYLASHPHIRVGTFYPRWSNRRLYWGRFQSTENRNGLLKSSFKYWLQLDKHCTFISSRESSVPFSNCTSAGWKSSWWEIMGRKWRHDMEQWQEIAASFKASHRLPIWCIFHVQRTTCLWQNRVLYCWRKIYFGGHLLWAEMITCQCLHILPHDSPDHKSPPIHPYETISNLKCQ